MKGVITLLIVLSINYKKVVTTSHVDNEEEMPLLSQEALEESPKGLEDFSSLNISNDIPSTLQVTENQPMSSPKQIPTDDKGIFIIDSKNFSLNPLCNTAQISTIV